jgi:hypothetical protein
LNSKFNQSVIERQKRVNRRKMSGFSWPGEIYPSRREKFVQNFPILNVGEWLRRSLISL